MPAKRRSGLTAVPDCADDAAPAGLDTSVPHMARVYDYWLGGKNNFAADRQAAAAAMQAYPGLRRGVMAQREFLRRAVQWLAAGQGIRQFLDVGTGLPSANNTHEVVQAAAPECRIVYVDNDPLVLSHARALLTSSPQGVTAYLDADLRNTGYILDRAAGTLDFSRPVALMLLGILQLIPDGDQPYAIVARLLNALPGGSFLAIAHPASDVMPAQMTAAAAVVNRNVTTPATLRTYDEVCAFFAGSTLVPPGVVQLHRWNPPRGQDDLPPGVVALPGPGGDRGEIGAYCGVGRKT
ncbi:MAG: SAM-dependent methyltransferase [Streptosporangiaceae bacterium]